MSFGRSAHPPSEPALHTIHHLPTDPSSSPRRPALPPQFAPPAADLAARRSMAHPPHPGRSAPSPPFAPQPTFEGLTYQTQRRPSRGAAAATSLRPSDEAMPPAPARQQLSMPPPHAQRRPSAGALQRQQAAAMRAHHAQHKLPSLSPPSGAQFAADAARHPAGTKAAETERPAAENSNASHPNPQSAFDMSSSEGGSADEEDDGEGDILVVGAAATGRTNRDSLVSTVASLLSRSDEEDGRTDEYHAQTESILDSYSDNERYATPSQHLFSSPSSGGSVDSPHLFGSPRNNNNNNNNNNDVPAFLLAPHNGLLGGASLQMTRSDASAASADDQGRPTSGDAHASANETATAASQLMRKGSVRRRPSGTTTTTRRQTAEERASASVGNAMLFRGAADEDEDEDNDNDNDDGSEVEEPVRADKAERAGMVNVDERDQSEVDRDVKPSTTPPRPPRAASRPSAPASPSAYHTTRQRPVGSSSPGQIVRPKASWSSLPSRSRRNSNALRPEIPEAFTLASSSSSPATQPAVPSKMTRSASASAAYYAQMQGRRRPQGHAAAAATAVTAEPSPALPDPATFPDPQSSFGQHLAYASSSSNATPSSSNCTANSSRFSTSTRSSAYSTQNSLGFGGERSIASTATSPSAIRTSFISDADFDAHAYGSVKSSALPSPIAAPFDSAGGEENESAVVGLGITSDKTVHPEGLPSFTGNKCQAMPIVAAANPNAVPHQRDLNDRFSHHRVPSWARQQARAPPSAAPYTPGSTLPQAGNASTGIGTGTSDAPPPPPVPPPRRDSRARTKSEVDSAVVPPPPNGRQRSFHESSSGASVVGTRRRQGSQGSASSVNSVPAAAGAAAVKPSQHQHPASPPSVAAMAMARSRSSHFSTASSVAHDAFEFDGLVGGGGGGAVSLARSGSVAGSVVSARSGEHRMSVAGSSSAASVRSGGGKSGPPSSKRSSGAYALGALAVGLDEENENENGVGGSRSVDSSFVESKEGFDDEEERGSAGDVCVAAEEDEVDADEEAEEGEEKEKESKPPAAVQIWEEGNGKVVEGLGKSIDELEADVVSGTTHLLLSKCATPDLLPSFLDKTLPSLAGSLLALDLSLCNLSSLPDSIAECALLEELKVSGNALRPPSLPAWLGELTSLRVLIADDVGIVSLPSSMVALKDLHTLSLCNNRLTHLPSWLHHLTQLEVLLMEGNPFQGAWKKVVAPILPQSFTFSTLSQLLSPCSTPSMDAVAGSHTAPPDAGFPFPMTADASRQSSPLPPQLNSAPPLPPKSGPGDVPPGYPFGQGLRADSPSMSMSATVPVSPALSEQQPSGAGRPSVVRRMQSSGQLSMRTDSRPSSVAGDAVVPMPLPLPPPPPAAAEADSAKPPAPSKDMPAIPAASSKDAPPAIDTAGIGPSVSSPSYITPVGGGSNGSPVGPADHSALLGMNDLNDMEELIDATFQSSSSKRAWQSIPSNSKEFVDPPGARGPGRKWGFLKKMSLQKMRSQSRLDQLVAIHGEIGSDSDSRPVSPAPGTIKVTPPESSVRRGRSGSTSSFRQRTFSKRLANTGVNASSPSALSPNSNALSPVTPGTAATDTSRLSKRKSFLMLQTPSPTASVGMEELHASSPALWMDPNSAGLSATRPDHADALKALMAYLRDLDDLNFDGGVGGGVGVQSGETTRSQSPTVPIRLTLGAGRAGSRRSTLDGLDHRPSHLPKMSRDNSEQSIASKGSAITGSSGVDSDGPATAATTPADDEPSSGLPPPPSQTVKYKDDPARRRRIILEILSTEETYVKGLQELVDIYVKPAALPAEGLSGQSVVPLAERKAVFGNIDGLLQFHHTAFLPCLKSAAEPLLRKKAEEKPEADAAAEAEGELTTGVAEEVAKVFTRHAAFLRMYSVYINNCDDAHVRVANWTAAASNSPAAGLVATASVSNLGIGGGGPAAAPVEGALTPSQKKKLKQYLKRCRAHPKHSQINLESYLLLPVQRIPRYKLLLEDLVKSTPPKAGSGASSAEWIASALDEVGKLATSVNESKRESEGMRKLVKWQSRIQGKWPSPLVQPHRRLIKDGTLTLTRVVKRAPAFLTQPPLDADPVVADSGDDPAARLSSMGSIVQVYCLHQEAMEKQVVVLLCNDIVVLCRDPSRGRDPNSAVELHGVLRLQPKTAEIIKETTLRVVDHKSILYFKTATPTLCREWRDAVNSLPRELHLH